MASIFNTATTISGRVARILNFVNSGTDFFVGIGKPTPWDASFGVNVSDINPPLPLATTLTLPEPIIYKRVKCVAPASTVSICFNADSPINITNCSNTNFNIDQNAEVLVKESFTEQNYILHDPNTIVNTGNSFNILPEFVYVQAEILGEDYAVDGWRASALYTKLYLADGVPDNLEIYSPNQVTGGLIQQITYNTLVEREDSKIHRLEYIINV